jgi:hypothetical protein
VKLLPEQEFLLEAINRSLASTDDPEELRETAKELALLWQKQKSATRWVLDVVKSTRPQVTLPKRLQVKE